MDNWNIQWNQEWKIPIKSAEKSTISDKWFPPPRHVIQLNFDGASKGNLGKAGFGGIFRDHKGAPLLTFIGSNGWDTNNSVELEGLWQGLLLAQTHGFFPLMIEGDSQILINMVNKILHGPPSNKVGNSWRLDERLELIEVWLRTHRAVNFKHIRREGNKVADLLAKIGMESNTTLNENSLPTIATEVQMKEFNELVKNEKASEEGEHPDASDIQ